MELGLCLIENMRVNDWLMTKFKDFISILNLDLSIIKEEEFRAHKFIRLESLLQGTFSSGLN